MIRPGGRSVRALLALTGAGLAVPFFPPLAWLLGAGVVAVAAALALEARALSNLRVTAARPEALALSHGEEETIELALSTGSRAPLEMTVRQVLPELFEEKSLRAHGVCRPGERLAVSFPVTARARGTALLPAPWVSLSRSGWAERMTQAEALPCEVTVLPDLRAVRRLRGQLDRLFLRGTGARVSPRLGKGREFDRLREYVAGDDLRDIAWKSTARHGKLITREFRLDRSQDVLVCVDRGHRMAARVAHGRRLDHAVNAAVLLGSICDRMEDRVGLLSFADEVETGLPQGRGATHLRRLTAFAARLSPTYRHTDYAELAAHLRRRQRSRSLILILTALPELEDEGELVKSLGLLLPQHLPMVVAFTDPALEAAAHLTPHDEPELCRTLVARDLVLGRKRILATLRRRGVLVVETPPGEAGVEAVNGYLEVKRRQLL